jgi:hypothetical protein
MCITLTHLILSTLAITFVFIEPDRFYLISNYFQDSGKEQQPDYSKEIFPEGSRDSLMWLEFLSKSSYRVASPEDFSVPATLTEYENPDLYRFVNLPCVAGDFNDDGAGDRACIVINKNRVSINRFRIVAINGSMSKLFGEEIKGMVPSIHWITKNMDLSNVYLMYALRSGLTFSLTKSGAKRLTYKVIWDKKRNSYIYKIIGHWRKSGVSHLSNRRMR